MSLTAKAITRVHIMILHGQVETSRRRAVRGKGLLNKAINSLPFELHLPGYQYCGPGTKLQKRLARGDPGVNPLDRACKEHDIAYSQSRDTKTRNIADARLSEKAWERVKSSDSTLGERTNAWLVTNIMKAKTKFGMGLKQRNSGKIKKNRSVKRRKARSKKRNHGLRQLIAKARADVKSKKPTNLKSAIKIALAAAKRNVVGKKSELINTRVIPIPKTGGVLPLLLPIFAGLSAIGALSGGASGIAKAINEANQARKQLSESERHNRTIEAIAMGKGLYLKPYKKGLGLYLNPKNS